MKKVDKINANYVLIEINGVRKEVLIKDYIKAKTKQLRAFGYPSLTEPEVENQLYLIFNGKPLNIIGMMMEDDIAREEKKL